MIALRCCFSTGVGDHRIVRDNFWMETGATPVLLHGSGSERVLKRAAAGVRRLILDFQAAIFRRNLCLVASAAAREWNSKTRSQLPVANNLVSSFDRTRLAGFLCRRGASRGRPRSAGLKPPVSPICNRQCANRPAVVELFTPRGLQIRDTAGCKSALQGQCADAPLAPGSKILELARDACRE